MAGGRKSTFAAEDDGRLIDGREVLELGWKKLGSHMSRPWQTCRSRYMELMRPLRRRRARKAPPLLHETLGIKTQVVDVAVNDAFRSSDRRRMKITLAAV